jgi:hypothetical protein
MNTQTNEKNVKTALDNFLGQPTTTEQNQEMDCSSGTCVIKNDKSLIERINKKIIVEDGRQLLI